MNVHKKTEEYNHVQQVEYINFYFLPTSFSISSGDRSGNFCGRIIVDKHGGFSDLCVAKALYQKAIRGKWGSRMSLDKKSRKLKSIFCFYNFEKLFLIFPMKLIVDIFQAFVCDVGVDLCRCYICVTEHLLDTSDVSSILK